MERVLLAESCMMRMNSYVKRVYIVKFVFYLISDWDCYLRQVFFPLCFRKVKVCLYFPKNICGYISVWKGYNDVQIKIVFLQDDR